MYKFPFNEFCMLKRLNYSQGYFTHQDERPEFCASVPISKSRSPCQLPLLACTVAHKILRRLMKEAKSFLKMGIIVISTDQVRWGLLNFWKIGKLLWYSHHLQVLRQHADLSSYHWARFTLHAGSFYYLYFFTVLFTLVPPVGFLQLFLSIYCLWFLSKS